MILEMNHSVVKIILKLKGWCLCRNIDHITSVKYESSQRATVSLYTYKLQTTRS